MADRRVAHLVEAVALEIDALQAARTCDALDEHALGVVYRESAGDAASYDILRQQLGAAAAALATLLPFAAQRLLSLNEQQAQRGRHGVELAYCMARLHQHQGRPQDALRRARCPWRWATRPRARWPGWARGRMT